MRAIRRVLALAVAIGLAVSPVFAPDAAAAANDGGKTPSGFSQGQKNGWSGATPPGWTKGNKTGWQSGKKPPGLSK